MEMHRWNFYLEFQGPFRFPAKPWLSYADPYNEHCPLHTTDHVQTPSEPSVSPCLRALSKGHPIPRSRLHSLASKHLETPRLQQAVDAFPNWQSRTESRDVAWSEGPKCVTSRFLFSFLFSGKDRYTRRRNVPGEGECGMEGMTWHSVTPPPCVSLRRGHHSLSLLLFIDSNSLVPPSVGCF
ncbi:hypothetical protein CEXT_706601 [Caerostris extrusa]|uniref:Uncharacterized protein n=1 Tax=Caerostris extrusa TaxID=172846 RepID=A0AAV4Q6Q6_CAEEX|nr:hypothetical protein CEXT_706601 [Caerostris extrusa]